LNKSSTRIHVFDVDRSAGARLFAEKFPSNQVTFPIQPAAIGRTKVPDGIHQVNCARIKNSTISGTLCFAFQSRIF